jgi:HPt (histidine-containing phosphotransfer) domain-containing protein
MDDYVSKPVRAEALGRMLERWVFASDPVLDPAALEDTCGDDTEARDDLVKLFLEHSAGELEQLRDALAAGELDGVRATAHSLSGSAGTLGAVALASACGELSRAARAQETDGLGARMAQVEQAYEATSARLAAMIGARSSA